jgi:hypothetical protein
MIGSVFWRSLQSLGRGFWVGVGFSVWVWTNFLPSFGVP